MNAMTPKTAPKMLAKTPTPVLDAARLYQGDRLANGWLLTRALARILRQGERPDLSRGAGTSD